MSSADGTYWFWTDWLGDQAVRRLTLPERGMWIDLLALAAFGNPVGYVCDESGRPLTHEEIARVTRAASPVEVAELIDCIVTKGAASRDRTGRVFNRRMVRDAERAKHKANLSRKRAKAGAAGAKTTNLKYKSNRDLPRQMPGQSRACIAMR